MSVEEISNLLTTNRHSLVVQVVQEYSYTPQKCMLFIRQVRPSNSLTKDRENKQAE